MNTIKDIEPKDLIELVKSGDKSAFATLYDNYSPALYGIVYKIVKTEEVSEDVLQEVFVKIWKKIHFYNPEKGTIYTWMLNIARNTAIDKIRTAKNKHHSEIQNIDDAVNLSKTYQTSTNIDVIGLKEVVNKLAPEQKIMVEYIYFNGYTQQEVADELNMPLGTVKTRIRTAVRELKKVFNVIIIIFWI